MYIVRREVVINLNSDFLPLKLSVSDVSQIARSSRVAVYVYSTQRSGNQP